jgi:beta-N-acetylhexosaminidase
MVGRILLGHPKAVALVGATVIAALCSSQARPAAVTPQLRSPALVTGLATPVPHPRPPAAPALVAEVAPPAPPCVPAPLAVRAARTLLVGIPLVTDPTDPLVGEVLDVGVGGLLFTDENVESYEQAKALVHGIRARATWPLVMTADEEPGRVTSFAAVLGYLPSARRLAAQSTPEEVHDVARQLGVELAELGITLNLAPVADLDDGPWDGLVGDRSFSADPDEASRYALAWARGLASAGVTPVTKHFPGHGRSATDSHTHLPEADVSLIDLAATDLQPFADAVSAGVPAIMLGHVAYDALEPSVPASMSARAYELLRGLGFEGLAITDSIGMGAVNLRWDFGDAAVQAVRSGADAVLATDGNQARWMRDALVEAVAAGLLDEARLNEAAARMAALAGDDPVALACQAVALPRLSPARG